MKKVAIASLKTMISNHFGRCEYFVVYDILDNRIISSTIIENPPHQKGFLPNFLKEQGIDVLITGSIGEMAFKLLKELGIVIYRSEDMQIQAVIDNYLAGKLEKINEVCQGHNH